MPCACCCRGVHGQGEIGCIECAGYTYPTTLYCTLNRPPLGGFCTCLPDPTVVELTYMDALPLIGGSPVPGWRGEVTIGTSDWQIELACTSRLTPSGQWRWKLVYSKGEGLGNCSDPGTSGDQASRASLTCNPLNIVFNSIAHTEGFGVECGSNIFTITE